MGMIFLRCEAGLSHNPAERVSQADVAWGMAALHDTVVHLAKQKTKDQTAGPEIESGETR